ncbi:hypothetical protein HAX54_010915 [Datura stramonium]|uniref:Uncharacterized protein n=1 Tax=Datura stramonium TaxID=4076 RepID=A0ABS8X0A0_DATST|nr:hypothetical protein [Datura stramonium]
MREVKTIEGESVPLYKENEVKPKENDSPSPAVSSTKPVVKIEETKSESMEAAPTIVEEVKKDDEVEKPIVEALPSTIIEKLKSTNEEEKQKVDEPQFLEIEEVKKAEEEQKPIADKPVQR